MVEFIVLVLGFSLFLYALLAGADFGAGVLEILPLNISREKKSRIIGKAMGPVWEANHIWLILALVIVFNAFPKLYVFFSDWFHFPIGAFALGIIIRGASFTFLHYDPIKDNSQKLYRWLFGLSSIWCTFWIGVMVGSLMLGAFTLADTGYEKYFAHWLTPMSFMMGLFFTLLSMLNATLFLSAEFSTQEWKKLGRSIVFFLLPVGAMIHLFFWLASPERWKLFFFNPLSLILIFISAILIGLQLTYLHVGSTFRTRILAGLQVALIMGAGFLPLYPAVVVFRDGDILNFFDIAAGAATLKGLVIALIAGTLVIFPGYVFLMKVFKGDPPGKGDPEN